jgi:hypothetical protein
MLSQLLKPLAYLCIVHADKRKVDWYFPLLLSVVSLLILESSLSEQYMWKAGGLISMTLGFVQSLPGFYIAALAAVATFGKEGIDSYLPEPMPYINTNVLGETVKSYLTRRTFLCMLFAFLTYESIVLVVLSIACILIGAESHTLILAGFDLSWYANLAVKFIYLLILFQMIIATFWGLFYLGYKIHE